MSDLCVCCLVMGEVGLDTVSFGKLSAVVGPAPAEGEPLAQQVKRHADTVAEVWESAESVVPLRFGTVFRGPGSRSEIRRWLELEAPRLESAMVRVAGCEEFGVDVSVSRNELLQREPKLAQTRERAAAASRGLAYLLERQLEDQLARHRRSMAEELWASWQASLGEVCRGLVRERAAGQVLKLSCLVARGEREIFLGELARLEKAWGVEVRATGPWPPYSFVE